MKSCNSLTIQKGLKKDFLTCRFEMNKIKAFVELYVDACEVID